jgi:UDP-glucose 4-epimerase
VTARRVLITGVSGPLGARLAARLAADPGVEHVVGIDTRRPPAPLADRIAFVEADLRRGELAAILKVASPQVVIHHDITQFPEPGRSRRNLHDLNVIGTLQLLAACGELSGLRQLVVRSSAAIYGSGPGAPAFFTEDLARSGTLRTRFQRDVAEIENYFETHSRRHPDVTCTMLRYQPAIGPKLATQMSRYLSQPACPTYLGFDPRLQLVHEEDALDALVAAIRRPVRGAVNVAASGTIGLGRMIRAARRPRLPLAGPLFGPFTGAGRRLGFDAYSDDFRRLLRYGRGVDIGRLERELGHRPRYTTAEAVESWVAA